MGFAGPIGINPFQRSLQSLCRSFYFKGTEMGTQMFLQLVELAEQLLDLIRVLHAGRGLGEHLLQSTHSDQ